MLLGLGEAPEKVIRGLPALRGAQTLKPLLVPAYFASLGSVTTRATAIMALQNAAGALRALVSCNLRLPVTSSFQTSSSAFAVSLLRGLAGGAYLDKTIVTDRVLHVTKHFEKIDPGKV